MAYQIGAFAGALVITLLMSRIFRKWPFGHAIGGTKALGPNVLTLAIATVLGGFGFANGGGPRFLLAAERYVVPVLLWTIMDVFRWRSGQRRGAAAEAPPPRGGPNGGE